MSGGFLFRVTSTFLDIGKYKFATCLPNLEYNKPMVKKLSSLAIETSKLTKIYDGNVGIKDVDLAVNQGEIFGFIGPNGAGKSTTIRTLLGLIKPTSGSAKIFGKDTIEHGPEVRKRIGYLPSEVFYYDGMRVKDLLRYSASFYDMTKLDIKKRMNNLADILDLDLNRKIDDLSYGNKKKVGIVQGLLHRPDLIILDEPTGGLDPLMQQTFFDLLREENKRGTTILFSSHILGEVQKLCDRVGIIKDGSLVKVENVSSLRERSYVRCRLESRKQVDLSNFAGVSDFEISNNTVNFLYRGDVNVLLKKLSGYKLNSLYLEEPELEEIFMHYYQKDL